MATVWDPAKSDASITISGGGLTITGTVNALKLALATVGHTTGLKYWEVLCNASFTSNDNIGMGNASAGDTYMGSDSNGIGWINDGRVLLNNANLLTIASWLSGDLLGCAVNFGTKKMWFRKNAGGWNNDILANQNPATGAGGLNIAGLNAGPYFPGGAPGQTSTQFTGNFGGSSFSQSMPAGFTAWDFSRPPFVTSQPRIIT